MQKITLCSKCAIVAGTAGLKPLTRMKDKKVKCDRCGRTRYGAEYEAEKKRGTTPQSVQSADSSPDKGSHNEKGECWPCRKNAAWSGKRNEQEETTC